MDPLREQNRMIRPSSRLLALVVSLGVHLLVLGTFASRVLFPEVLVAPDIVVFPIRPESFDPQPERGSAPGPAPSLHAPAHEPVALAAVAPAPVPPSVALPLPDLPALDAPTRLLPGIDPDRARLDTALRPLSTDAGRAPRAAFEGTVYLFSRTARLRTARGWFQGASREVADERLYTHALWVPGRGDDRVANPLLEQAPWIGVDYEVTLHWPQTHSGIVAFRLTSDSEALFQIDGEDVIAHDGRRGFRPIETVMELPAGPRHLRLSYIQGPRSQLGLILHYRTDASGGWRVFDLREILRENLHPLPHPLNDELDTALLP